MFHNERMRKMLLQIWSQKSQRCGTATKVASRSKAANEELKQVISIKPIKPVIRGEVACGNRYIRLMTCGSRATIKRERERQSRKIETITIYRAVHAIPLITGFRFFNELSIITASLCREVLHLPSPFPNPFCQSSSVYCMN